MGRVDEPLALIIHHLAVDGVSWRILLEDLNRLGSITTASQSASGTRTSFARGRRCCRILGSLSVTVRPRRGDSGRDSALLHRYSGDTYATAANCRFVDTDTTRLLLGISAAFHAGFKTFC
ncbi:hypothetical protein [Mycobacterium intracellulare]|uniref:hypothetical protein n=1 Tax=Mycobacterium intracellulare TaxID=1767 RepID=UPI00094FDD7B|nr:hypothetical protein [Mycobacterium intracellulare]